MMLNFTSQFGLLAVNKKTETILRKDIDGFIVFNTIRF